MAWPITPLTSYVPGTPPAIKSSDLDDFQQAINWAYLGWYTFRALKMDGAGGVDVSGAPPTDGTLDMISPSAGELNPRLVTRDANGNARFIIDHNGLPTGAQRSELRQDWFGLVSCGPGVASFNMNAEWVAVTSANAQIVSTPGAADPGHAIAANGLLINPGTGAGNFAEIGNPICLIRAVPGFVMVLEWIFKVRGQADNVSWYAGWNDANAGVDPTDTTGNPVLARVIKRSADTNWQLQIASAGAASYFDSGVAPGATSTPPYQRFRLEYHGSSTPFGAAALEGTLAGKDKVRLFINGNRLVTQVINAIGTLAFTAGAYCSGVAATSAILGSVLWTFNRFPVPDVL
jgi:hypothetical protein